MFLLSARQSQMVRLLVAKLVQGVVMLIIVSAITFGLLSAAGGDALSGLRDNPQISERTIGELQKVYGLDKPWTTRYLSWVSNTASGDLGESMAFRIPVKSLIAERFLNTLLMGVLALALAVATSVLLAAWSTKRSSAHIDGVIESLIFITASTPRMVLALVGLLLSLKFVSGTSGFAFQLVAGAVVLAVPLISIFLAQLKGSLDEVMLEDFIRTARAKGLSEWSVITKHALRAGISPFLTALGLSLGGLLGGSVIVESVLGWQGIGALMVSAVRGRDVPVVMGVVLITSAAVWFGNVLAEILQYLSDARIRTGER